MYVYLRRLTIKVQRGGEGKGGEGRGGERRGREELISNIYTTLLYGMDVQNRSFCM